MNEITKTDVVANGRVIVDRLLEEYAYSAAQLLHRERAQIHAVHRYRTAVGIIETAQQLHQRTLPRPVSADNRDQPAGPNREIEIVQREFPIAGITKRHALKADARPKARGHRSRLFR